MSGTRKSNLLGKITVLLVICFFALPAHAKYGGGTGETNDPYLIYDANQMNAIGADQNDWDKHFKLMADIDLSGFAGTSFNIIGYYVSYLDNKPFKGVFDGNGHTISNFTYTPAGTDYIGFFGYVSGENAEIKDLGLINSDVDAGTADYVGSLVGRLDNGTINNCHVEGGSVEGDSYIGGLVGNNDDEGKILSCSVNVHVKGSSVDIGGIPSVQIGGICGLNEGVIFNSSSSGVILGGDDCGGIAGKNFLYGRIQNCFSNAFATGHWNIGGIAGINGGYVIGCVSTGNMSGKYRVGGLIGRNDMDEGIVTYCYSTGEVWGDDLAGGLLGETFHDIQNCYTVCAVDGNETVGAFIGGDWNASDTFYEGCIWNTDINPDLKGIGDHVSDPNGIYDFNTFEMQDISTYQNLGWDFVGSEDGINEIWAMPTTQGYPILWWQQEPMPPITLFTDGAGTETDPFVITDPNEIKNLSFNPALMNKCYVLGGNIDLSGESFSGIGSLVIPFTGKFEGCGNTIANYHCADLNKDYIGMFNYICADGQIKNLTLENVRLSGRDQVGAIAGYCSGTIKNCHVTGLINGHSSIGGIVGRAEYGYLAGSSSNSNVSGTKDYVGGIAGAVYGNIIEKCHTEGTVSGLYYIGGISGYMSGEQLVQCFSSARIEGDYRAGGLIGQSTKQIEYCYFLGEVIGKGYIGGLIGDYGTGNIADCYSAGSIIGTTETGGLVGHISPYSTLINNYWDVNSSGLVDGVGNAEPDPNGIEGKTSSEMKQQLTYAGWDFVEIWNIGENQTYPYLRVYLAGDINKDRIVNFLDLSITANQWMEEE